MPFLPRPSLSTLFYTLRGLPTNPHFLLIHGWTCDSTDWIFTIPALLPNYRIISLDWRGHGHSSTLAGASYTIADFASDAVALLTHLNITKDVRVLGHSMGGIIASCLTGLYPEMFSALVVIDPPYWRTKAFWASTLPKWDELQDGLAFVTLAFGNQMPPEGAMPPWMLVWYGMRMEAVDERVVGECLKGGFGEGMLGQLEAHRECVKGREVLRLAVYMTEENCGNERGLGMGEGDEVVCFGEAGHWLHHVKAEEFNAVLARWLEEIEK